MTVKLMEICDVAREEEEGRFFERALKEALILEHGVHMVRRDGLCVTLCRQYIQQGNNQVKVVETCVPRVLG